MNHLVCFSHSLDPQKYLSENCQVERRMLKYLKNFIPLRASISTNENCMRKIWGNTERLIDIEHVYFYFHHLQGCNVKAKTFPGKYLINFLGTDIFSKNTYLLFNVLLAISPFILSTDPRICIMGHYLSICPLRRTIRKCEINRVWT